MAEIELGVLQCLDPQRNREAIRVDWRFTTQDARVKLKSLYPLIRLLVSASVLPTRLTIQC